MSKARIRDDLRNAIAARAARLMAEDGIEDYGLAKRKAAKQLGIGDTRRLPNNDEIDAARHEYNGLFNGDAHGEQLRFLREKAVQVMRALATYDPHLTGPVLSGVAGPVATIELQLYPDNVKSVELFMLDRGIQYQVGQKRLYAGDEMRIVPTFSMEDDGAEIALTVLEARDLRVPLRGTPGGRVIERARLKAVEMLLWQKFENG